ncbi:MAG TPA: hypothetical protein VFQ43_16285, partial [Nitrososphaera sp.]|nr:hypothetical protein [Nitrososphaera sp.]
MAEIGWRRGLDKVWGFRGIAPGIRILAQAELGRATLPSWASLALSSLQISHQEMGGFPLPQEFGPPESRYLRGSE